MLAGEVRGIEARGREGEGGKRRAIFERARHWAWGGVRESVGWGGPGKGAGGRGNRNGGWMGVGGRGWAGGRVGGWVGGRVV